MTTKPDMDMLDDLDKAYVPAQKGIISEDEMMLVRKRLELEARSDIELQNIRNTVVMFYANMNQSDQKADPLALMASIDKMSAICAAIDMEKNKRGLPV